MNKCCANRISGEMLHYWQVFREARAATTATTTTNAAATTGAATTTTGGATNNISHHPDLQSVAADESKEFGAAVESKPVLRDPSSPVSFKNKTLVE